MALQSQEFTASGTFVVPAGVSLIWLTMIATGGTGTYTIFIGGGSSAGESGAFCSNFPVKVTPGANVTITIPAAAASLGKTDGNPNNPGRTSFGALELDNGANGFWDDSNHIFSGGGLPSPFLTWYKTTRGGGGAWSGDSQSSISPGTAPIHCGSVSFGGGSSGGCLEFTSGADKVGYPGGAAGGQLYGDGGVNTTASGRIPGPGGGSSVYGRGGAGGGGFPSQNGNVGGGYGAGGGGAGGVSTTGGAGATGYCLVSWTE